MKKIFTLIMMCVMAYTAQAAITIYVKAEKAPNLWAWTSKGNVFPEAWPGSPLTQKTTVKDTEFWYYTFADDITSVSILFNDGAASGTKQTANITGITTDRYFEYDGADKYVDVTEQYGGVIPDAKVESLSIKGNHDGWGADVMFDVVEAGKSFKLTYDLSTVTLEGGYWFFKIRPNADDWVGYSQVTIADQPAWVAQAQADDNFQIDFENTAFATTKAVTITATWAGGKDATAGWTLTFAVADPAGISSVKANATTAIPFNLAGQRVANGYKGLVIKNGKKVMVK